METVERKVAREVGWAVAAARSPGDAWSLSSGVCHQSAHSFFRRGSGMDAAVKRVGSEEASVAPPPTPGTTSGHDEEGRLHYQRRLMTCFGVLGVVVLAFESLLVVAVVLVLPETLLRGHHLALVARLPVLLVGWWVCRGRLLGASALAVVEAGVTTVFMALSAAPLLLDRTDTRADLGMITVLLLLLALRAGLLPSMPRRVLVVSSAAAAPLLVVTGVRFVMDREALAWTFFTTASVWSLVAVVASVVMARTVHGLRAQGPHARKLGQYTLEEKIGEGGMGAVYRARHALLRRPAAIKLLRPVRASESDLARFEREVQLTSQLTHPNTVSIFDYGRTAEGGFYYVMEYLDGLDLSRLVKESGPLPPARVIRILTQVSGALHEAHLRGLVHRDIKPANIILTERADEPDVAKVVDFGLVRSQKRESPLLDVTLDNAVLGTPAYLAPEAILAADSADARSDLYALGAVGYFLLTGQSVFRGTSLVDLFHRHLAETPVPPSHRAVQPIPADLEAVILACLAKAPEDRPPSAQALCTELLRCADSATYDRASAERWWQKRRSGVSSPTSMPPTPTLSIPFELRLRGDGDTERVCTD